MSFWATPGGAAAISGAASLVGGLLGSGGSAYKDRLHHWDITNDAYKKQFAMMGWQRDVQERFAKESTGWQFDDLMEAADQAGIHRLSALGGAQSYQPAINAGFSPSGGPSPASRDNLLGDAVGDALNAYHRAEQIKHQKAMDKADLEIRKETANAIKDQGQLWEAQSRTEIAQARRIATDAPQWASKTFDEVVDFRADPMSTRPEEARIKHGPLAGLHVQKIGGRYYVNNPQSSPAALLEETTGSVVSEIQGATSGLTNFREVYFDEDHFEWRYKNTKGKKKSQKVQKSKKWDKHKGTVSPHFSN